VADVSTDMVGEWAVRFFTAIVDLDCVDLL
jgi:hypothetical protein